MRTIRRFAWFTRHSWSYMAGERAVMFRGFLRAWRKFNAAAKADEREERARANA